MIRPHLAWPVHKQVLVSFAGVLVLTGALLTWLWQSSPDRSPAVDVPAPHHKNAAVAVDSNPGYLGSEACASCHAARVAEFKTTRHFAANKRPQFAQMPDEFSYGTLSIDEWSMRFEMIESHVGFIQTANARTDSRLRRTSSEIAFCYGSSGGNDEVYFTWHGDRLFELPVAWLAPLKTWGASPFDHHGSGDFSRETTIRCVECHNTWVEHVPGTRNQYSREHWILGVTCEVCHGPGQEHVSFHEKNPLVSEPHDVVRPALLSRERKMDLCAQCHSNALKHRGPAFSYRPGQPLDDYYYSLRTSRPEDDHVANQTTYLRQSRCFQKSDSMTCVTCHNPHQPRSDTNAGAASCRTCHSTADCTERSRLPAAIQDECIKCHMPERRKIQVFFQTETDKYVAPVKRFEHRIGVYPDAKQEVLLDWYRTQTDPKSVQEGERLAKELGEWWRTESEHLSQEFRYLAAIDACRNSIQFDPAPAAQERLRELITIQWGIDTDLQDGLWHEHEHRYPQAIEAFQRVLKAKPNHVNALGKLGTTYAVVKQPELAIKHLKAAASYDPDDPYAPGMLGWLAYLDGHPQEALEYFRQAEQVEPYSAKINYQMGLALAKLDRVPEAIGRYQKAVEIDPMNLNAHVALSQLLRQSGKPDDALHHSLRAAQITEFSDSEVLLNLAESYAGAKEYQNAIRIAQRALDGIKTRSPQLATRICEQIELFRSLDKSHSTSPADGSRSR